MTLTRSTHTCSSCTARQQEMRRLQKRVRALESELAVLRGVPEKTVENVVCAACGHHHPKTISRHHRVPQRISWKIPRAARKEVLGDAPEIINLCQTCHRFIEQASSTFKPRIRVLMPCGEAPIGPLATVTWGRLMEEIRLFEKIADNITEDLMAEMKAGNAEVGHFGEAIQRAIGAK